MQIKIGSWKDYNCTKALVIPENKLSAFMQESFFDERVEILKILFDQDFILKLSSHDGQFPLIDSCKYYSFEKVEKITNLNKFDLTYHLNYLEKFGFVIWDLDYKTTRYDWNLQSIIRSIIPSFIKISDPARTYFYNNFSSNYLKEASLLLSNKLVIEKINEDN
jgi:hypothetical protein